MSDNTSTSSFDQVIINPLFVNYMNEASPGDDEFTFDFVPPSCPTIDIQSLCSQAEKLSGGSSVFKPSLAFSTGSPIKIPFKDAVTKISEYLSSLGDDTVAFKEIPSQFGISQCRWAIVSLLDTEYMELNVYYGPTEYFIKSETASCDHLFEIFDYIHDILDAKI